MSLPLHAFGGVSLRMVFCEPNVSYGQFVCGFGIMTSKMLVLHRQAKRDSVSLLIVLAGQTGWLMLTAGCIAMRSYIKRNGEC